MRRPPGAFGGNLASGVLLTVLCIVAPAAGQGPSSEGLVDEAKVPPEDADVAAGLKAAAEGRWSEATTYWEKDLASHPERPTAQRAGVWLAVGSAHLKTGSYQRALECLTTAEGLFADIPGCEGERVGCLQVLEQVHTSLGQHQQALETLGRAWSLCRDLPGATALQARCLDGMGDAYSYLGREDRAIELYQQALTVLGSSDSTQFDRAEISAALGTSVLTLGRLEEAQRWAKDALELYSGRPYADGVIGRADCHSVLASIALFQDDLAEGLRELKIALDLYGTLEDAEDQIAVCLVNIAAVQCRGREYGEALATGSHAESILLAASERERARGLVGVSPSLIDVERSLGNTYRLRSTGDDLYLAYRHYARATLLAERSRARATTGLAFRASHFGQKVRAYDDVLKVLREMQKRQLPIRPDLLEETSAAFWGALGESPPGYWQGWETYDDALLSYVESSRARVLRDLLTGRPLNLEDAETRALWTRLASLVAREQALNEQLSDTSPRSVDTEEALAQELRETRSEREQAEAAFGRTAVGELVSRAPQGLDDWRTCRKAYDAALVYRVLPDVVLILVIVGDTVTAHTVELRTNSTPDGSTDAPDERLVEVQADQGVEQLVSEALAPLCAQQRGMTSPVAPAEHLARLSDLYQTLLQSFEPSIGAARVRRLLICPDGPLAYLPFGMLVRRGGRAPELRQSSTPYAARSLEFVMERWEIGYAPSLAVCAALIRAGAARPRPRATLLALADPIFSAGDERLAGPDIGLELARASRVRDGSVDPDLAAEASYQRDRLRKMGSDSASLARLPYTRLELDASLRAFGGAPERDVLDGTAAGGWRTSQGLVGAAALEPLVYDERLRRYGHVLIASHGIIDTEEPMSSHIALTAPDTLGGTPDADPLTDGYLTVAEAFGMPLNARTVTLSGCETGLGRYDRGEGLLGFPMALFAAGARSVTVSLWAVDDARTATLMGSYHRGLARGETPVKALSAAQRRMLASGRHAARHAKDPRELARAADPTYWAPFIVIGPGR